jgi:hypothetical protein
VWCAFNFAVTTSLAVGEVEIVPVYAITLRVKNSISILVQCSVLACCEPSVCEPLKCLHTHTHSREVRKGWPLWPLAGH